MNIELEKSELLKKIAETDDVEILKAIRIVLESEKKSTK
jgi:hypothetical protein